MPTKANNENLWMVVPVYYLSSWKSQYNTLEHKQDLFLMELTTID